MRESDSRAAIHRFYMESGKLKGAVNFEREEGVGDAPVEILDFQVLVEIPAKQLTYDAKARTASLKKASFTKFNVLFKNAGK